MTGLLQDAPGTICLPTSEVGRFAMFTVCLATTRQPPNTNIAVSASASVVENLNACLEQLRDEDEWVWLIGDDHVWRPDTLMRMLEQLDDAPEADILVPLVCKRSPPWALVVYKGAGVDGDGVPLWQPFGWDEIPRHGLFEIEAAGNAGMVIRRHVLDEIGKPWFKSSGGVYLNEDVTFCAEARAVGYRIFATSDVVMGHLGIFNVRAAHNGERWGALTEFSTPEEQFRSIFMPIELQQAEVIGGRG